MLPHKTTGLGFAPRLEDPKASVLLLHHPVKEPVAGFAPATFILQI